MSKITSEQIDNQNYYYIYFNLHDGDYSFSAVPNFILAAPDHKTALNQASELMGALEYVFDKFVKVEFNVQRDDLIVEVIANEYFDKVTIHEYMIYDGGEDAVVTKGQFLDQLKDEYKEYLDKKKRLTFESNAYGVVLVHEVEHL